MIDELASLLLRTERARGVPALAQLAGASHLCIFIRDPALHNFIPGPGFPQTLARGIEWRKFLTRVTDARKADATLISPFTAQEEHLFGFHFQENAIAVLFGEGQFSELDEAFCTALQVAAALLGSEMHTVFAEGEARFAHQSALESRRLSQSLSEAHDRLAEVLQTKESLLEDLRQKEARLELIRQMAGMGIWEWNRTTGQMYLGPEVLKIHGLPLTGVRESIDTFIETIHPDDRPRVIADIGAAGEGKKDYDLSFRVITADGGTRFVASRALVLQDARREAISMVGFSMDITRRVMTEEALVRSEKLAAAGRLAASIAHEINNPLEAIVNLVYLARGESNPSRTEELLEMADRELSHISAVTRQTLGFYRDSNQSVQFDLVSITQETLDLFGKQIRDSGVVVISDFPPEKVALEGWPGEIKQVIANLLINALHASKSGVPIAIRIKQLRSHVVLLIADQGSGIRREHLEHIFEPFFSTKNESGTGLGLWISRQIVQKHGGSIRVRSRTETKRHGTLVKLHFPLPGRARLQQDAANLHLKWQELAATNKPK